MYSDPQTVGADSLPRIGVSGNAGTFQKADGTVKLSIAHSKSKSNRIRSQVRVDSVKIVADPLVTGTNLRLSSSAYLVLDRPVNGYTVAELVTIITSLTGWLTATSNANATKLGGQEV